MPLPARVVTVPSGVDHSNAIVVKIGNDNVAVSASEQCYSGERTFAVVAGPSAKPFTPLPASVATFRFPYGIVSDNLGDKKCCEQHQQDAVGCSSLWHSLTW